MRLTRVSMLYLASYLTGGGIGLLADPDLALRLLGSTSSYSAPIARLAGGLMAALGIVVIQIFRHDLHVLHKTTVAVRTGLVAMLVALYVDTGDRLFLVLTAIVGFGMILTITGLIREREPG